MLLAGLQPRQRLGEDLVAIAAQPFDVDPLANRADGPVAAVAGRVLHELDVVERENKAGAPRVGAGLVAVGGPAVVDAAGQRGLALVDVGFAPGRHFGGVGDDRSGDAAGKIGWVDAWRRNALTIVGREQRLEHAVFADSLERSEDPGVVGLGARVERAVEHLHDVL